MRALLLPVAIFLLSACVFDDGPRTLDETNPTVSYRYDDDDDYDEVEEQADEYCEDFNRDPELVDRETDGSVNVAIFECVS